MALGLFVGNIETIDPMRADAAVLEPLFHAMANQSRADRIGADLIEYLVVKELAPPLLVTPIDFMGMNVAGTILAPGRWNDLNGARGMLDDNNLAQTKLRVRQKSFPSLADVAVELAGFVRFFALTQQSATVPLTFENLLVNKFLVLSTVCGPAVVRYTPYAIELFLGAKV